MRFDKQSGFPFLLPVVCLLVIAGCPAEHDEDAATAAPTPADDDDETVDDDPESLPILAVVVEDYNSYLVPQPPKPNFSGDLWAQTWADNDYIYAANGDGYGFGWLPADMKMNRLVGRPPLMWGEAIPGAAGRRLGEIWPPYEGETNRKPTGMTCVDGVLYLFYQNLKDNRSEHPFSDAPAASISWSIDYGWTWQWDEQEPMFDNHQFTTGFFLDAGQCYELAPDEFVYIYGLDQNWRGAGHYMSTQLYLARAPREAVPERDQWEFFRGIDETGAPLWTPEIAEKQPVLLDITDYCSPYLLDANNSGVSQGSVTYVPALRRYLYATWSWTAWIFWEAPQPWGPWTRVTIKWWDEREWNDYYHGGYATVIPSKFLDDDGRGGWLVSALNTTFGNCYYRYAMRRFELVVADR